MFKSLNDLCDVVSLAVYCNADNSFLLMVDNSEHWFACSRSFGSTWEKTATKEITEIFGPTPTQDLKILRISKLLISRHTVPYLLHVVFYFNVDVATKNKSKNTMGKYRGKCRWVTQFDLIKLLQSNNLRSPEVVEIYFLGKKEQIPSTYTFAEEATYAENLVETTDDNFVSGKGHHAQLVEASGIDRLGQETLLKDFMLTTFPAYYMNFRQFSKITIDLGWTKENIQSLFYAADCSKRFGLSFKEYIYFMAAVDPATSHGGPAAELRSRYMFKFYDKDHDGVLKGEDFKYLITDLRKMKKNPIDPPAVAKDASDTYKSMGMPEGNPITENDFLKAICDLKIRGTSTLFRSNLGVLKLIKDTGDRPAMLSRPAAQATTDARKPAAAKPIEYEVANHTVKIQKSGQALNIDEVRQIQDAVSNTTLKQPVNEQARRNSMDIFSQRSVSNEVLKALRYITSINKISVAGGSYTWGQLDPLSFGRNLINVAQQVKEVFKMEPRLLELRSPVYVMGDLHGNVSDLLYFEKVLWHIGPGLNPCSLLFLGDYVDRGAYSVEVITYLFAYKLQSPQKVNMLRGNHEIREVQKMFTFQKECMLKFGEKLGNEIWSALNNAFDNMPISAVVDGKIFCCHGGVPPPWLCPVITAINDIPVPLSQPDAQSSLAWEIMWNDPVKPKTVDDRLAVELLANEGFAVNSRRGTAHIFSVEALERFLKANQLTHLIRAHEVAQAGFQVQQKGKLLTVFSSSKYCGGRNDAACVMVDAGKLRILRLETN